MDLMLDGMPEGGRMPKALAVTIEDKAERVLRALTAEGHPKLTRPQLIEQTGLSSAQVSDGWRHLRGQPDGGMWIVEPHRHKTLYYLSEDVQPMLAYMMWQARQNYSRTNSLWTSTRQLERHMAMVRPDNGLRTTADNALKGLGDARGAFRSLVRSMGRELNIPDEKVEAMLFVPEGVA